MYIPTTAHTVAHLCYRKEIKIMGLFKKNRATVNICPAAEGDQRRPCYVRGRRAIFHRWVNSAHPVLPRGEEPGENSRYYQFRRTEALVEYEDGTVARVFPSSLQFADSGGFERYEWRPLSEIQQEEADRGD